MKCSFRTRRIYILITLLFTLHIAGCLKPDYTLVKVISLHEEIEVRGDSVEIKGIVIDVGELGLTQHGFRYWINNTTTQNYQDQDKPTYIDLGPLSKADTFSYVLEIEDTEINEITFLYEVYAEDKSGFVDTDENTNEIYVHLYDRSPYVTIDSIYSISSTSALIDFDVHWYWTWDEPTTIDQGIKITNKKTGEATILVLSDSDDEIVEGMITGLEPNTTYDLLAFAVHNDHEGESSPITFSTNQNPTVITGEVNDITVSSATVGGEVTSEGGAAVTECGIWYGYYPNPETGGTKLPIGTGSGVFSTSISGLEDGTYYYMKAYATSSLGTSYGTEKFFITEYGGGPVTDFDGNSYATVKIDNKWWMAENLKTTHYTDGTEILLVENGAAWGLLDISDKALGYHAYNSANGDTYGALYNWAAVMNGELSSDSNPSGIQGICPENWHVPSKSEFTALLNYLGGTDAANEKLRATGADLWTQNSFATNESGFTALPGGRINPDGTVYGEGTYANFWTSRGYEDPNPTIASYMGVASNNVHVSQLSAEKKSGYSVRCVHDHK